MQQARQIEQLIRGQATSDGAGVRLTRLLTQDLQRRLDPFLMLDSFATDNPDDYIAGFPEHPHRGFETVTYMLAGNMRHRDSRGNEGLLAPGSVQWMTAGRGILHSEMPEQIDGRMEGFQLWLNLPAKNKMLEPAYSDLNDADIPRVTTPEGVDLKLIAGRVALSSADGADVVSYDGAVVRADTEPLFIDLNFPRQGRITIKIPRGHNSFVYAIQDGMAVVAGENTQDIPVSRLAVLSDGDQLTLAGQPGSHAIVVAGRPLNEPIAQYGPFVMNTHEELMQAVQDMRAGTLGF